MGCWVKDMKKFAHYIINKTPFHRPGGKPVLALIWVCFFWGTTWISSKEGVKHMPAIQLCMLRQLIGGGLYVLYFLYKRHPWPSWAQWKIIAVLSGLNFFLSNTLSTWGVQYISSVLGAIIAAIVPLWFVIITLFQGKRLPLQALLGILLGFGGVCIIFYEHLQDFLKADFRFGIFLSVVSTLTWAIGGLYTKKHAAGFNPYFSIGLQMLLSGCALLGITTVTGNTVNIFSMPTLGWVSIAYLVVVGSVLTFIAYVYALQHLPTSRVSIYAYFNPIVAVLLGAIIFHEKLNGFVAVGGAVTIAGIYLVNNGLRKKTPIQ